MVKFKVAFTVSAETLFSLAAKMLPIEDLHIEELVERPAPKAVAPVPRMVSKPTRRRRRHAQFTMSRGINKIIVDTLKDGPQTVINLQPAMVAAGFSPNSISSRMVALRARGIVAPVGDGTWRLMPTREGPTTTNT